MEYPRQDPSVGEVAFALYNPCCHIALTSLFIYAALVGVYFAPALAGKVHLGWPAFPALRKTGRSIFD